MPRTSIRARLLKTFSVAILIPSLTTALVAVTMIRKQVTVQAQARVTADLEAAKEMYLGRLARLKDVLRIHAGNRSIHLALDGQDMSALPGDMERVRVEEGLDMLLLLDRTGKVVFRTRSTARSGDSRVQDEVVQRALREWRPVASTRIVPAAELALESPDLVREAHMEITPTRMAAPSARRELSDGMMLEGAAPVVTADQRHIGLLVGGVLLNRNYEIVDQTRKTVFKEEFYRGQEVGTATIFQDDVRVSTNVKNADGSRAITTRASDEVAQAVLGRGQTWRGRAFVVNDWYLSAYAPIPNLEGKTIGMLYVGTLERPYVDSLSQSLYLLLGLTFLGVVLVSVVAITVAQRISRPVQAMATAARGVTDGDYTQKVDATSHDEIGYLAESFNRMTAELEKADQERREWGESLERKVEQRTAELKTMQAQMLQSDKLASIGELVAGIAHEINNPNTFIRGNISIVAESLQAILPILDEHAKQDPGFKIARLPYAQYREYIEQLVADIGSGADKIMNIVADLRKFARHDEGLLSEDVDVNAAIDSCLRLVHNQVKRVAKVHLELAPDLPTFKGNVQKIEQVLVNIIINAAQAIEEKKQQGNIGIFTFLVAKSEVNIRITDDGLGMSGETKKRIFDPFFTTKRHKHGTGLGLSIAYGIITEHGGRIEVDSKPGEGSEFRLAIPLERAKGGEASRGAASTTGEEGGEVRS
jgi:two-component system, NtrC family, sensor kinase